MRTIPMIALSGLLGLAPVAATASPAAAPAAQQNVDEAGERVICKRAAKTGTRFQTKTCRTERQWDEIAEGQKRGYSEMRDRPVIETRRE